MREFLKNSLIVIGHAVCVVMVLFCIIKSDELLKEDILVTVATPVPGKVTQTPAPSKEPSSTPVPSSTPTVAPTGTLTPILTPTNVPTEMLTPTPTAASTPTVSPTPTLSPTPTPSPTPTEQELRNQVKKAVLEKIASGAYAELDGTRNSWWFRRKTNQVPSGSGEKFKIAEYDGYYRNENVTEEEKVIYITIDCGYGSSNTPVMLDIFKKHDVKVTFFVTEFFVDANPEYLNRMLDEGHMVGNHSVSHADMTKLTEQEVYDEIIGCEDAFYEATGQQINMFFRLPGGAYSKKVMQMIEDLGYQTMFWSIAYNDYDKDNQPTVEWILEHFETYHHNGALVLMHNDSDGNRDAMDQVLTYLKEQGYRFGTLNEFGQENMAENQ